jgi:predicted enzyme related to lactoylglutathione lyase
MEGYFIYTPPTGLMGGFSGMESEEPTNIVIYLYTPDITATLELVKAAGGVVVSEKEVVDPESGGGVAFFKDPAGVTMGLADMEMPQDYEPAPMVSSEGLVAGSIVAVELYGGDLEATGKFYTDLFGWSTASSMPEYLLFNTGKGIGGVFQGHTPAAPVMVYIWVDDVAAALDAIDAAGGKRLGDAMQMPGMPTFGYFTDPAGKSIGLMGPGV